MRVCLISREFPPDTGWGGIATFVHDLAVGLVEIGHEVDVIALSAEDEEKTVEYEGVRVHRVRWTELLHKQQRTLTLMPYTHNIIKQIAPLWDKFLALHRENPFDVVEAPEMFAEGLLVGMSKAAPLLVRLYTPHFKFIDDRLHNITSEFDHEFIAMLERMAIIMADVVSSPSEDLADYVCRDLNYPRENLPIVRDPVNTQKFCPDGPRALSSDGRMTILFAGRLEERKGVYHLVEAIPKVVKQFPSVRFVFLGRDTNTAPGKKSVLADLKRMLKKSGCQGNVLFPGSIPNSEMPAYFRSADICVMPSLYDNAPFTCIEALSSGVPVVGTTAGGMKEYIVDGQSGTIVPPANAEALAAALLSLLQDDEKRKRFGAFARSHAFNFDRKEIARQSIGLYKLAASNHAASKDYAIFRHDKEKLLPYASELLSAYEQMLYDQLYAHCWRFRIAHWLSMVKDRPRLTFARAILRVSQPLLKKLGIEKMPAGMARLQEAVNSKQINNDVHEAAALFR